MIGNRYQELNFSEEARERAAVEKVRAAGAVLLGVSIPVVPMAIVIAALLALNIVVAAREASAAAFIF